MSLEALSNLLVATYLAGVTAAICFLLAILTPLVFDKTMTKNQKLVIGLVMVVIACMGVGCFVTAFESARQYEALEVDPKQEC